MLLFSCAVRNPDLKVAHLLAEEWPDKHGEGPHTGLCSDPNPITRLSTTVSGSQQYNEADLGFETNRMLHLAESAPQAGVNSDNVDYIVRAIDDAIRQAPAS